MAGKYGYPYFTNYLNSDMEPEQARSMCPLTSDTRVLVKNGYGDIVCREIGDIYASSQKGTKYSVWNGKYFVDGKPNQMLMTDVYEITLSNGSKIKLGENHIQPTKSSGSVKAKELTLDMWIPVNKQVVETNNIGEYGLGYAVGAYIGDGSHDKNSIIYSLCRFEKDNETERKLVEFWNRIGYKTIVTKTDKNVRFVRVNGNPYGIINEYVSGENALTKDLCQKTFSMSFNFKKGLIEGFRDTDGSRSKKRLYTSSKNLRDSMVIFFATLGMKAMVNYEDNRDERLGTSIDYRIDYPERDSYGDLYNSDESFNYYKIVNIKNIGKQNGYLYCFEVDDDSHIFMLANGVITHNCRLRLDLTELRKRNGGLFGSGDATGSIGVVTVNLPRIAYESKGDINVFYETLDKYLDISRDSLVIKRKWLQENILDTNAIPAFMEYVGTIKNHFSTIGIVGMNEMCMNFMGKNILDKDAHKFCHDVGEYIRNKLLVYQNETGSLFNYEATPAESTCYRLALKDKSIHPDIYTQGTGNDVYYTNSCHIPVSLIDSIDETFKQQEDLQTQFTGGTVIHCYLEGAIGGEKAKQIVKAMFTNYKIPYMSLSPISRYCPTHGYIEDTVDNCPVCGERLKMYQRITGYIRCIDNFNDGKKAEFKDRKQIRRNSI